MKLNLSRLAKKFREMEPEASARQQAAKESAKSRKAAKAPAVEKVVEPVVERAPEPAPAVVEPVVEVVAPVVEEVKPAAPQPKVWPVKQKRERFVREKTEKREPVKLPPLGVQSRKFSAKLLTKNVVPVPKDEPKAIK